MNKKVIFRVDGNSFVASGHIMRCISYATYLKENGVECLFVTASKDMHSTIKKYGFNAKCLYTDYSDMSQEILVLGKIIKDFSPSLLIIDSYFVTETYLKKVNEFCKTLYIDDLNKFDYPVDYLLNYSIYAGDLNYQNANTKYFLGTDYLALRPQFYNTQKITINENINDVFITTGGADTNTFCYDFINTALSIKGLEHLTFHIIVGAFFDLEYFYQLEHLCDACENVILYMNVDDMAQVMKNCDVAISAGGSTMYELSYLGVPTICIKTADNQSGNYTTFINKKIALLGGDTKQQYIDNCITYLQHLDKNQRQRMQDNALALFANDKKSEILQII